MLVKFQLHGSTALSVLLVAGTGIISPSRAHGSRIPTPHGDWAGTLTLPQHTDQVRIDVQFRGTSALVALGPGHAALQSVSVRYGQSTLSFSLPGLPAPVSFKLVVHGSVLAGSVRQGSVTGKVQLTQGKPTFARFLGSYSTPSGDTFIVLDLSRIGFPPQIIDVGSDSLRGLYRRNATAYVIGAGNETRSPESGQIVFARDGSSLIESMPPAAPVTAARISYREKEVRFRSGKITLAGTLVLPDGAGPFAAVMMVHGSGPSNRDEGQAFSSYLAARGIASLKIDKRGIGQSSGTFPGELATDQALSTYAADTVAGGRLLSTLPEIDHVRIGLFGGSQAGWIIPQAAVNAAPLFSFAVILSGPVVSVGETSTYSAYTTQGAQSPGITPDQIDAEVRKSGPSGFDPRPWIQRLRIPVLWVYGGLDQNQPTRLDVPVLESLKASTGSDFSWVVFPQANHGLVNTNTGLNSEAARAPGFAPGFFESMTAWLHKHGLGQ